MAGGVPYREVSVEGYTCGLVVVWVSAGCSGVSQDGSIEVGLWLAYGALGFH